VLEKELSVHLTNAMVVGQVRRTLSTELPAIALTHPQHGAMESSLRADRGERHEAGVSGALRPGGRIVA